MEALLKSASGCTRPRLLLPPSLPALSIESMDPSGYPCAPPPCWDATPRPWLRFNGYLTLPGPRLPPLDATPAPTTALPLVRCSSLARAARAAATSLARSSRAEDMGEAGGFRWPRFVSVSDLDAVLVSLPLPVLVL